jgi:adenylosuccinate lyase
MEKGLPRIKAYDLVQDISLRVINNNSSFKKEVLNDARMAKLLKKETIEEIFNPYTYLDNIDKIYKRLI